MKRNLPIDFLRFCGVFMVMINHIWLSGVHTVPGEILKVIQTGGWIGVDLFFVISGYLVSGLIIKEYKLHNSFNLQRFIIRRGFKIYPTYYFFIIFQFVYATYLIRLYPQSVSGLTHEALFVANYFSNNNHHLWSISVEEHFYLLLALLFVCLIYYKKVNTGFFVYLYIFLVVSGVLFRAYNYYTYSNYDFDRDYTHTHYRIDALFLGVLIAYFEAYKKELFDGIIKNKFRLYYLLASLLFLSTNFIFEKENHRLISVINLAINPWCFGYILVNAINLKNDLSLKLMAPFAFIGKYSYSIYLFHLFFLGITGTLFISGKPMYFITYFVLAISGGILISKSIEYPMLKLREQYFPSKSI